MAYLTNFLSRKANASSQMFTMLNLLHLWSQFSPRKVVILKILGTSLNTIVFCNNTASSVTDTIISANGVKIEVISQVITLPIQPSTAD